MGIIFCKELSITFGIGDVWENSGKYDKMILKFGETEDEKICEGVLMKRQYKMTRLIREELIMLIMGVCFGMFVASQCENKNAIWLLIVLEGVLVWAIGFSCRHVLLLPIDLLANKSERIVYFSKMSNFNEYDLFKSGIYYCEWKFYSKEGILEVLVQVELSQEEVFTMDKPEVDQKVKVTYYKYSKILYSWETL